MKSGRSLKVSRATQQMLWLNGTLKYAKLGGIIFYDQEDVHQLLLNSFNEEEEWGKVSGVCLFPV